jgi:hypothetical protein
MDEYKMTNKRLTSRPITFPLKPKMPAKPKHKTSNTNKQSFRWYITTILPLDDPFIKFCVSSIRRNSKNKIESILIPQRVKKLYTDKQFLGIPLSFIDTQQNRPSGIDRGTFRINQSAKNMDEEHARLLGFGITKFPAVVVDADVLICDKRIDEYITKELNFITSCLLYFPTPKSIWTWSGSKRTSVKYFQTGNNIPFVHFSGYSSSIDHRFSIRNKRLRLCIQLMSQYLSKEEIQLIKTNKNRQRLSEFL